VRQCFLLEWNSVAHNSSKLNGLKLKMQLENRNGGKSFEHSYYLSLHKDAPSCKRILVSDILILIYYMTSHQFQIVISA
jgi:hypothetical protein